MRGSGCLLLLLAGCSGARLPDPVCNPVNPVWQPGRAAFEEATEVFGLSGVEGTRLVAIDFDNDGWIDLHVHRGTAGEREVFGADGPRRSWLLRNDQGRGFIDVTQTSGFRATRDGSTTEGRAGSVVAFGDVDNDGDLDAFTAVNDVDGTKTDDTSELMINNGDGTFSFGPDGAPWIEQADAPAGVTFVDFDLDGRLDLWVPRNSINGAPAQDRLYRGNGDGTFVDDTDRVGLTTRPWSSLSDLNEGLAHTNAWSANACDLNSDGWPDLIAASYGRAPNHLWQSTGTGTFVNRSVASGYAYDDNMDYTDNQFFRCWCQANPGGAGCAGVPGPAITCSNNWRDPQDREPYRNGGNSGATTCADVDNDGHIDLLTGEIQHWWAGTGSDEAQLLFNDGSSDVAFERPGIEATGLTRQLPASGWDKGDMTNAVFDFDNDGWADVFIGSSDYPGTRSLLWHQTSPRQFEPVATDDFFEHNRSHGVAVADFDNDGDLDIVVGHSRSRCGGTDDCYETSQVRLFRNLLSGNHVQLDLEGTDPANRGAVGARVLVTAGGSTQTFEVGSGYGHYGAQNPHRVHAGLGTACEAEVEIRWPDRVRSSERFTLPAGHRFRIVQGGDGPEVQTTGALAD